MEILNERRLSVTALAKQEKVSVGCAWRWVLYGVRGGIKLESCLIGGRRVTSQEAFARFVARINAEPGTTPATRTARQREAEIRQAEAFVTGGGN